MIHKLPLLLLMASALPRVAGAQEALVPSLQIQGWATVFDQDESPQADPAGYGDPEDDPGLKIARTRIGLRGEHGAMDYEVSMGTTSPYDRLTAQVADVAIIAAWARGTIPLGPGELRISAGNQRIPFGRERQFSSANLLFQERAVSAQWIGPGWDAGVLADYELDAGLRLRAGAFNGNAGASGSPGVFGDDNPGLLGVTRLEFAKGEVYRTFPAPGNGFGLAVSGLHEAGVATNTLSLGADFLVRVGRLAFTAEGGTSSITPGDSSIDRPDVAAATSRLGANAQLSWFQPVGESGVEIGARYALFDDAVALKDNGDVGAVHAGLTWWQVVPGLDLGAGYVHRMENGGRRLSNDTARLWFQVAWPIARDDEDPDASDDGVANP